MTMKYNLIFIMPMATKSHPLSPECVVKTVKNRILCCGNDNYRDDDVEDVACCDVVTQTCEGELTTAKL